mgnify:CR=1 FL=1
MEQSEKTLDMIVNLCKNRGYVFPGSEIYGGLANSWDYGPLGVEFKNNVKKAWLKKFVQESPYNVGLDAAIIMNPQTWVTTGHVSSFSDPLLDCRACKARHRADKLIGEEHPEVNVDAMSFDEMDQFIADHEDIVQEGMIGLYKAIRDYKPDKLSSFRAFAELCITRQIITAIKTATRQKHSPLNSDVSLNKPSYDEESDRTLLDVSSEEVPSDPEAMLIDREVLSFIEGRIGEMLSDLEKQVLVLYMEGKSYVEISKTMGRHVKSVDNALQRIKRKLQKYLEKK